MAFATALALETIPSGRNLQKGFAALGQEARVVVARSAATYAPCERLANPERGPSPDAGSSDAGSCFRVRRFAVTLRNT